MRILIASLILSILISPTLLAKDLNIMGCTADSKKVVLTIDINEEASPDIVNEIVTAFVKTAKSLTADELINGSGFRIFKSNLTEEDDDAIDGIQGPPVIDGTCKVA